MQLLAFLDTLSEVHAGIGVWREGKVHVQVRVFQPLVLFPDSHCAESGCSDSLELCRCTVQCAPIRLIYNNHGSLTSSEHHYVTTWMNTCSWTPFHCVTGVSHTHSENSSVWKCQYFQKIASNPKNDVWRSCTLCKNSKKMAFIP